MFKKLTWLSLFGAIALASCGVEVAPPQTYFSDVFKLVEDTYMPTKNAQGQIIGNFIVQGTVVRDGISSQETYALYTTGLTRTINDQTVISGALTNRTTTTTYDYAATNGGVFTSVTYASSPSSNAKQYTPFTSVSLSSFTSVMDHIASTLTPSVRGLIQNQVTNLAIGGVNTSNNVYNFQVPVLDYLTSYASFEPVTRFIPTAMTVNVGYTPATQATTVTLNASNASQTVSFNLTFTSPGAVNAANYTLSLTEKQTYTGF